MPKIIKIHKINVIYKYNWQGSEFLAQSKQNTENVNYFITIKFNNLLTTLVLTSYIMAYVTIYIVVSIFRGWKIYFQTNRGDVKKNLPISLIRGLKSGIISRITISRADTSRNIFSLFSNKVLLKNTSMNRIIAVKMSML